MQTELQQLLKYIYNTHTLIFRAFTRKLIFITHTHIHIGDLLLGKISCHKHPKDPRSLAVTLSLELSSFHPDAAQVKVQQDYVL